MVREAPRGTGRRTHSRRSRRDTDYAADRPKLNPSKNLGRSFRLLFYWKSLTYLAFWYVACDIATFYTGKYNVAQLNFQSLRERVIGCHSGPARGRSRGTAKKRSLCQAVTNERRGPWTLSVRLLHHHRDTRIGHHSWALGSCELGFSFTSMSR